MNEDRDYEIPELGEKKISNQSYTGMGAKKSSKPLVDLDSGTRTRKRTLHM